MTATTFWGGPKSEAWYNRTSEVTLRRELGSRGNRHPMEQPEDTTVRRNRLVQCKVNGSVWAGLASARMLYVSVDLREWLARSNAVMLRDGQGDSVVTTVLERHIWKTIRVSLDVDADAADIDILVNTGAGRTRAVAKSLMVTQETWSEFARQRFVESVRGMVVFGRDPVQIQLESNSAFKKAAGIPVFQTESEDEPIAWCVAVAAVLLAAKHLTDANAKAVASAAMDDVRLLARIAEMPEPKSTNVSEEGLVSLVWETATNALLVIFTGDGEASFSVKALGDLFVTITDFVLANGLPAVAKSVLDIPTVP